MKKHNYFVKLAALALALVLTLSLTACGGSNTDNSGDNAGDEQKPVVKIAVPNDTTNEARALLLLQENGIIKLKDGVGITATKNDIEENPYNVEIVEAEAAQLPNQLQDVDYAVINSNYAISAGLNPVNDSLLIEGSASAYANILTVKEGNENEPKILALKAALESQQVVDFINETYNGSVISVVENPTDGYDATVDYDALNGETITIAATPAPHAEILEVVKTILADKGITLNIQVFNDYVQPNTAVEDGAVDANYFQHLPYLEEFNETRGTHLVSVAGVHIEPMGIYAGRVSSLEDLPDGAVIAVPNDATNEGRALLLLEAQGLITLDDSSNLTATPNNIVDNPKNLEFQELEAATIPSVLADVDLAVINSNYALGAGLNPTTDALAIESSDSPYVNVLVVKEGNENNEAIQALVDALHSDTIRDYITETFDGAVVPAF